MLAKVSQDTGNTFLCMVQDMQGHNIHILMMTRLKIRGCIIILGGVHMYQKFSSSSTKGGIPRGEMKG